MAFSTQKDFFHVPFMNENVGYSCKKASVKLKSYNSTIDDRSWAIDITKQSKFLSDLVTCQIPTDNGYDQGNGDEGDLIGQFGQTGTLAGITKTKLNKSSNQSDVKTGIIERSGLISLPANLIAGDSLLECANVHLAEYQKILKIKTALEKKLEVSNERLKIANEQNKKIQEILASKLDSTTVKDFFNKIQKLTVAGKLEKNDENEMLHIYQKMENIIKSYEILQAENNYLKRLIEKLAARSNLDNIQTQPEESNDVMYLQKEVNNLRKECIMLRQMEDEYQMLKQERNKSVSISGPDAENIKAIVRERNSLREKCKSIEALEEQVQTLEKKAQEASKDTGCLNSNLNNQMQYIDKLEGELRNMQKYYEDKSQKACFKEECLRSQLEDLKNELIKAKCLAQRADMSAIEICSLRKQLLERDLIINDYDCQYKQLMDVVNELQCVKLQFLNDNQTQIHTNETDELAFFTCATLDEIMKELKRKSCFNEEFMITYGLEYVPKDNEEYCQEVHLLQQQLDEAKEKINVSADTLKRVENLEDENTKLLRENQILNEKIIDNEKKLSNLLNKIEHLDKEINRNGEDAYKIGKDLEGTLDLVKDISDMQLKNQQLVNVVSAINSRDDQKIIDDLRQQLEKELVKFKKCQKENVKLIEEAKLREMELKQLKDLNNKLKAEKEKFAGEKNKVRDDNDDGDDDDGKFYGKNISSKYDQHTYDEDGYAKEEEKFEINKHVDSDKVKDIYETPIDKTEDYRKVGNDVNLSSSKRPDIIPKYNDRYKDNDKYEHKDLDKDKDKYRDKDDTISMYTQNETLEDGVKNTEINDAIKKYNNNYKKSHKDDIKAQTRKAVDLSETPLQCGSTISPHQDVNYKQKKDDKDNNVAFDNFVKNKSNILKLKLQYGCSFQKELREILDEFIQECGFCFCRLVNPKSKFYAICHKLYHCGIKTLSFRELAYLHKKIYAQAEQLLPGCLLNMILSDNIEQVENILSTIRPDLGVGTEIKFKLSDTHVTDMSQKCCCCKNELCCNNSEEMFKDKVNKLEKDIEIARGYLESLKNIPTDVNLTFDIDDNSTDANNDNLTFRATSHMEFKGKNSSSKHLKKIEADLIKKKSDNKYRL